MDKPQCVLVLTTWPADGDASAALEPLVEERFAACLNVLPPMQSIYRWQGAVERASERQVIIKTSRERAGALVGRLKSIHPYDVPEILVVPVVDGEADYLRWIGESTTGTGEKASRE